MKRFTNINEFKKEMLGDDAFNKMIAEQVDPEKALLEKYSGIGKDALKNNENPIDALKNLMKTRYEAKVWEIISNDDDCLKHANDLLECIDAALQNANESKEN